MTQQYVTHLLSILLILSGIGLAMVTFIRQMIQRHKRRATSSTDSIKNIARPKKRG